MKKVIIIVMVSIIFVSINIVCIDYIYAIGGTKDVVTLPDPLGKTNPQTLIGKIIKAVLGIVGSLALVMFIYGGFTWMLAGGNAEKVTKGRNILVWATIGLVVIFSSYALVKFVLEAIEAP